MKNKTIVAITGTIGSGKSTLCNILEKLQCKIISADKIGHQILPEIKQKLVETFGESILSPNNKEIDKKKLANLIFSNKDYLEKLNEITHPKILKKLEKLITESKKSLVFVEIPPVFSVDISRCFDLVVQIKSCPELLKKRLIAKDKSYLERIKSQLSNKLLKKSNYNINNDGTIESLKNDAKHLLDYCQKIKPTSKRPLTFAYLSKVCVCVSETDLDICKEKIDYILKQQHLAEFRLDFLPKLPSNLENWKKKGVVATLRTKNQGGHSELCGKKYAEALYKIDNLDFEFIDIEFENAKEVDLEKIKSKIILSYHNFDSTPQDLEKIVVKMTEHTPYCIKVATMIQDINDNFMIFRLLQKFPNLIAFGMGEKGELSRVLCLKYGSPFTYTYLPEKSAVAPGQIDLETLSTLYNIKSVNSQTAVYGLIGQNIAKSSSRAYHNKQFSSKKINACFVNFPIDCQAELTTFLKNFLLFEWKGAAITMPYKQDVFSLVNSIDNTASEIGAINTLCNDNGKLNAYNTDWIGAIEPLLSRISLLNKKVLLLGNGGAAKAILFGLFREKAQVTVAARSLEKSKPLVTMGNFTSISLQEAKNSSQNFDVIINASKVGMNEDISLLSTFKLEQIVMDIVYQPLKTKMLQLAEKQKAQIIFGDEMLYSQAEEQEKIWLKKQQFKGYFS